MSWVIKLVCVLKVKSIDLANIILTKGPGSNDNRANVYETLSYFSFDNVTLN